MEKKKNRKKLSTECSVCKAQFDIWVDTEHADSDLEEGIRKHVNNYCPVCKALEELNNIKLNKNYGKKQNEQRPVWKLGQ